MSATATRPKVRPLDPLDLDGLLSDEDRLIAETVRRFAADRVLPHVEEWYEQGTLPSRELAPAIGELGLLGMHLSGYGCAGASATSYGVACRELEAADSGLRSFVSVQGSLAMFPIWKFGSDEQKERWLPGLPEDAVLPDVTGMRGPLSCLSEARYGILWGAVGAARTCLGTALEYAKSRPQFGRPIAAFQLTQQKLVNMMLELQKAQLLALHIGRLKDEGRVGPEHISMGKLNNVREALAIAREARTILGANGIS